MTVVFIKGRWIEGVRESWEFKLNCWTNSGFPNNSDGEVKLFGWETMLHLFLNGRKNWGRMGWRMRFHNNTITIKKRFRFMFRVHHLRMTNKIKMFHFDDNVWGAEKERRMSLFLSLLVVLQCPEGMRSIFLLSDSSRTRKLNFYDQHYFSD